MVSKKEIATALLMLAKEKVDINFVSVTEVNKLRVFLKERTSSYKTNDLGDSYIGTIILGEKVAHIYLVSFLGDKINYTYRITNKIMYILNENILINKIKLNKNLNLFELTEEKAQAIIEHEQKENQKVKEKRHIRWKLN